MIEHDVETTGLQYASGHRAFIHQFGDDEGNVVVLEAHQKQQIQAWLDRCEREGGYRAWNSKFDLHFADAAGLRLPDPACWHDGMLVAHVVDERRSVALQNVAESLFGEEAKSDQKAVHGWLKEERARRKKAATAAGEELLEPNFSDVPRDIMDPYAKEDIVQTRAVCDHYAPIVAQSDLQGVVDFERKVMAALFDVEKRGMPADEHGYRMLELELAANLETLEDRCVELAKAGSDFNPKSSQQLYEALEGLGADLSLVEGKSMDRENLSTVDHPLALAVLAFRGDYKALSTYTRPMISRHYEPRLRSWQEPFVTPEGRIHANYRQLGARTGRMSCSMPNMQNMPRDDLRLRYNIRAEEGHKLVTVDLSGVEMRLFAAFAGGGPILDALRKGEDPHVVTAERLGLRDKRRTEGVETARQRGKTFNFCRSLDTEILTRRGFVNAEDVQVGEETIGYNPETRQSEWTTITDVNYFSKGELWRLGNQFWSATSTPEHQWVTERMRRPEVQSFLPSNKIGVEDRIVLSAPAASGLGSDARLHSPNREDDLVGLVLRMTKQERAAWVHAMCLGEGWQTPPGGIWSIGQNPGKTFDAIALAVYLEGHCARLGLQTQSCWRVRFCKPSITGQRLRFEYERTARVWCPTTELGSWTAREDGHIHLTGNSQLYGGGLPTITKQLGCSRADARRYRDRYRDEFPEIVRLQQRIKWRLEDQGFIQSLWGRHYRVAPRDAFKAVNYLVQGTAADLLKESLLTVHRAGVPVVALVHDEIVAHVPEGDAEEAKEVIRRALVDHPAITEKVPLEAEGAIVDRWSDAKIPGYMPKWAKREAEARA